MPPLVEEAAQKAAEDAATALVNNVNHLLIHLIMRPVYQSCFSMGYKSVYQWDQECEQKPFDATPAVDPARRAVCELPLWHLDCRTQSSSHADGVLTRALGVASRVQRCGAGSCADRKKTWLFHQETCRACGACKSTLLSLSTDTPSRTLLWCRHTIILQLRRELSGRRRTKSDPEHYFLHMKTSVYWQP